MIGRMYPVFRTLFFALFFSGLCSPAESKSNADIVHFKTGEEIHVKDDKAYALMRYESNTKSPSIMLLRIPSTEEMVAYETAKQAAYQTAGNKAGSYDSFLFKYQAVTNFYEIKPNRAILKKGKSTTVVVELPTGNYVIYGTGWHGSLYQCFCFGTVGFQLKKGEITDIGKILVAKAWKPSKFPELAGEDDLGTTAFLTLALYAVGLKPTISDDIPTVLADKKVVAASLFAVGPYLETNTALMNRMAPIPGVLAYDNGKVIDVSSGLEVLPNF